MIRLRIIIIGLFFTSNGLRAQSCNETDHGDPAQTIVANILNEQFETARAQYEKLSPNNKAYLLKVEEILNWFSITQSIIDDDTEIEDLSEICKRTRTAI